MINSLLGVVLVVVVVFCVPLALVEKRTIVNAAQDRVDAAAVRVLALVENRLAAGEPVTGDKFANQVTDGQYVEVDIPGKEPVSSGARPAGNHLLKAVEQGASGETVTVEQSRAAVDREIANMLLLLGVVALLAVQAAVALAVWQAKRLARPLTDLAETAERLGSGDPGRATAATGCPNWTGSPRCWTSAPNGSPGCSPPSGGSPPTPPTSCARRSPRCPCGWRRSPHSPRSRTPSRRRRPSPSSRSNDSPTSSSDC